MSDFPPYHPFATWGSSKALVFTPLLAFPCKLASILLLKPSFPSTDLIVQVPFWKLSGVSVFPDPGLAQMTHLGTSVTSLASTPVDSPPTWTFHSSHRSSGSCLIWVTCLVPSARLDSSWLVCVTFPEKPPLTISFGYIIFSPYPVHASIFKNSNILFALFPKQTLHKVFKQSYRSWSDVLVALIDRGMGWQREES